MARSFPFHASTRYHPELLDLGLDGLEACLSFRGGEVVKSAVPGREVRRVLGPRSTFFVKTVVGKGWREVVHEASVLGHLASCRMPVPEPVAMGAEPGAGAMVTLGLPVVATLEDLFLREDLPHERRAQLWDAAARLLKELHSHGTNHRDYYAGHVLVDGDDRLFLVDLGRAEVRTAVPFRRRVKDLAAFQSSVPERLRGSASTERFLEQYLGAELRGRIGARFLRAVLAKEYSIRRHAERSVLRGSPNIHVNR